MASLEHKRLLEYLSYNPDTGIFIWLKATGKRTHLIGKQAGSIRPKGNNKSYLGIRFDHAMYTAGRLAWFYMNESWPYGVIDHINGNALDNRYSNLRDVTIRQNQQNIVSREKKSGLPLGVKRWRKKYAAFIYIDGIKTKLGIWDTAERASAEYINARRKYFGEYNRL